jgi:predicted RNA-binding protein associated with RNAse of E/G family
MELAKTPIKDLTKEQFEEAYKLTVEKYKTRNIYLDRNTVLSLALQTGQITQEKFNELL